MINKKWNGTIIIEDKHEVQANVIFHLDEIGVKSWKGELVNPNQELKKLLITFDKSGTGKNGNLSTNVGDIIVNKITISSQSQFNFVGSGPFKPFNNDNQ